MLFTCFLILLQTSLAFAKPASCIVQDISAVRVQMRKLECSLDQFGETETQCENTRRDLKALVSVYTNSAELDNMMQNLVDDLKDSVPYNSDDSLRILTEFSTLEEPLADLLGTFEGKHCDFVNILGPFLTHRVIGANIKNSRCKMLVVIAALACRLEDPFSDIARGVSLQIDSEFQAVISEY